MTNAIIDRTELNFLLYDFLNAEELTLRERYSEHNLETFQSSLDTAEAIASEMFAPHNALADAHEPSFDGQTIQMLPEVKAAVDALADAGFIAAREDFSLGGMQLPELISAACMAMFTAANPGTSGYPFLTAAAAKVIGNFANEHLKEQFLPPMLSGKFSGTMALTEPQAGSSLADITTSAEPLDDGTYRIKGNKIYISGGDQAITDNIVHLVLAKIKGAPAGVKGISLFLVPKFLLDDNGIPAKKNDVELAGLFHKLGYRGTTSTALNFGENNNCIGYLIGEPHQGLRYMFQMMNEARLGVGMGAAVIGYRGYQHSLAYAKERPQGRKLTNNDPSSPQVNIIEHADVKRMLLAQKAYTEGGLALCLYGSRLVDDLHTIESEEARTSTRELLDLLTPIMKAWPSEYGVKANDLAIQVLGGAGYIREYPVEQCWRDNRLNPIHEGTNGIQALDLLGRKLWQNNSQGLQQLLKRIQQTLAETPTELEQLKLSLGKTLLQIEQLMPVLASGMKQDPEQALSLASPLLHLLGHTVVAWIWLQQANIATNRLTENKESSYVDFYKGKIQAAKYFFQWELPLVERDILLIKNFDRICFDMKEEWF